jgi:hypothetical protein
LLIGLLHEAEPRWILGTDVGELREGVGEDLVPVPSGVLVDESSTRARMAHAGHQLLGASPGRCGEGVPGVPEVVEVEVTEAHRLARRLPDATVEVASPKWRAIRRREDQALRSLFDVDHQVSRKLGHDVGRKRNQPSSSFGLRRAHDEPAALQLLHLTFDADGPRGEVDIASPKSGCLPKPKSCPRREQHHRAVPRLDLSCKGRHLCDGEHRSLSGPLDARAAKNARIATDDFVVDGGRQHRAQKSVRLRGCRRAQTVLGMQPSVPGPDHHRRDPVEWSLAEFRKDVKTKEVFIELDSPRPQCWPLGEPG